MEKRVSSASFTISAVKDGVSITSANVFYALSNQGPTGTPPADAAFTYDDFPNGNLQPGYYVWQATVVTFSDGKTEVTGKMCLGATTDFLQGTEVYATSQSGTNPPDDGTTNWKTTYTRQKGYYLWTATRVTYTNGTVAYLNKKCVGYWGTDGTSPWIADLSNEMDSVACDLSGKPTAAKSLTTTIALFYGQTPKSFGTPTVKRNGTAMTVNASSYANGVKVTYSNKVLTVAYNTSAVISGTDEYEITITASDDSSVVRTLTFSVLGARPGATGEPATTYQLVPSASEIVKQKDGSFSPASLTCYCTSLKAGTATDNPSAATMQFSYDGSDWTAFTGSTSFAASTIYAQTGKRLYLRLLVDGKVMDKETIPVLEDGENGVSITSANVFYALSDQGPTGTPPADTAFTYDDFPNDNLMPGMYVWQATVVTFSDGKTEVTGKMCLGATTDFLQGTEVYATSQSGTNPPDDGTTNWKTTYTRQKGYYLWTATRVQYTNGSYAYLNKKCVGYWGEDGNEGKGYKAVVYRENFTEANWGTYGTIGHEENWNYTKVNADGTNSGVETKDARNGCRVGDWFVVVGTATDTGYYHVLTYECDNSSGNLHGKCINHQITKDGENGLKGDDGYGLTLTPAQLIFEEKLGSDGQTVSIDYVNNTVVAVVYKGKTPLTPTITKNNTSSGCDLMKINISGDTITMASGSITLASGASAGFFTVNIKADDGKYNQDVRINFYVNRLGTFKRTINGAIETAKGEMTTYVDNKDSIVRNDYAVAIQTSAQGLTQKFTEQVSRAGADGRNLFGFSNDIVFENAIPFIQGYGLIGRPWLRTSDKTARIYNLGMYGRLGYYTVSCQVRTSSSSGYVRLQMNWHTATSGTQATSGGIMGCVYANTSQWKTLEATFLFDNAAEGHIGTSLQTGEAGSFSLGDINGYIDIGQVNSGTDATRKIVSDNLVYVRHLKIEYRDSASDFCESDEDIAAIGQGDIIPEWEYHNMSYASSVTINGTTYPDFYYQTIDWNAGTSFWCLSKSGPSFSVKAGKIYTLSYWARTTSAGMVIRNHLYNQDSPQVGIIDIFIYDIYDAGAEGTIIEGAVSDGRTYVRLSTTWKQYFVRFYVTRDVSNMNCCACVIFRDDNEIRNSSGVVTGYRSGTVFFADVHLQEGYVMDASSFSSLIEQNARRISLVQQSGTKRAGIDIQNGTVNLFGDRVIFSNADGTIKDKVWIDPEEGTLHAVNGEFAGTVKASNLYHNVCVIGDESWGYCTQDWIDEFSDEGWIGNFTIGSYYTEEQARLLSGDSVGIDSMLRCTYAADIVIAPNLYNNSSTRYVTLPAAKDFPGKLVEVIDCAYTNGLAIGNIIVGAADDGYFGLGINASSVAYAGSSVNIGSGGKARFYSLYKESRWWWLKLI